MALHPDFPDSPHAILDPAIRWFPADEAVREQTMDKLMPPLVAQLRRKVQEFRDSGYVGASPTSVSLLNWWFRTEHLLPQADGSLAGFEYFFAQREAIETIVWLVDVAGAHDKHDLMRYDSHGSVSANMFDETWLRLVVKMATGSGKTKVLALALAWSFYHKMYEPESTLARNFLLITPNIIVLDRIYKDFQGLRIFWSDPIIPDNGVDGHNWRDDFQLTLHVQDDVRVTQKTGNIFLTNIHRVYDGNQLPPSSDDENTMDYFLGRRPTGGTTDSKVDLGMIVRDVDELMVLNDEAHHIHDPRMAWFQSIQDIHNRMLQKDSRLSLQLDVTATPRHDNGAIFVQTIADYPLVEAIRQNVVKHPVLPDAASRSRLAEKQSKKFTEKYADYVDLGVIEWRKAFEQHAKVGKKAILFVMTDDTKNCDDLAAYLEGHYPDLQGAVLTIHTKNNGDISEASSGKAAEELEELRKKANEIDDSNSPWKAIVSVMMLKEGWDVRNVTTIVGLRPYAASSNILPEQTLGRGLRKMYPGNIPEFVSVIGTNAFMEFIESINHEGVSLDYRPMGERAEPITPLVVEIDNENEAKDIEKLDIEIPILTPRVYREYKNLDELDARTLPFQKVIYQQFSQEEQREIVFRDVATQEVSHTTILESAGVGDYRNVIGYFTQTIMRDLRLVSGYDVLYGKIKSIIEKDLFGRVVDLEDPNTLRNLSELGATMTLIDLFKRGVNALTVRDRGDAEIRNTIRLRETRPFVAKEQGYLIAKKSVFNRIIGDSSLELKFGEFLENCSDVTAFAKNYFAVGFKLDYITSDGNVSNYYPDFIVRTTSGMVVIVETKGLSDLDVPPKIARLRQWCDDVNRVQSVVKYDFVFVDEDDFSRFNPRTFQNLLEGFTQYKTPNTTN